MSYQEKLATIRFPENTWQNARNQTELYRLIMQHFSAPLPKGKRTKKAIVIGYDGCTCEMLNCLDGEARSAVKHLIENGGHAIFSYAGGAPYPAPIVQETSTAPGWCSMLTGTLAERHRVFDNGITKAVEPKTLFLRLAEEEAPKSSAFYVSWEGHFSEEGATYLEEKRYVAEKQLSVKYVCAESDEDTRDNVLRDLASPACSDFLFCILEYTDHAGHGVDYLPEKPEYLQAFYDAEKAGMDMIDAVRSRETFAEEDWLVLITSDHGGYHCGHGGPTLEGATFIISNQEFL